MSRILLLCPGQGGQHAGMFDLARSDPDGAALLARLALPQLSAPALFDNRSAQPAVVAASVAMWEALRRHVPAPALVAGYSVGELAAYAVAGALDAGEALRLAHARAALMDDAARATPGQCLAAVGGLPLERLRPMLGRHGFEVAIVTGGDSAIAGGLAHALPGLELALAEAGARMQRLPVGVASHTPLMAAAVEPFARLLDAAHFSAQACPVLSGIGAERVHGKAGAVAALSRQLAQPIVWSECMDAAAEAGIGVALELGPGAALSRMLQARHPGIACRSVTDFRSIEGIAAWLSRQAG